MILEIINPPSNLLSFYFLPLSVFTVIALCLVVLVATRRDYGYCCLCSSSGTRVLVKERVWYGTRLRSFSLHIRGSHIHVHSVFLLHHLLTLVSELPSDRLCFFPCVNLLACHASPRQCSDSMVNEQVMRLCQS
jgi:hypothetical protein